MRFYSRHFITGIVVLFVLLGATSSGLAQPKYTFKIGSIAPEGSVWVDQFHKFTDEVTEKTGGEVGFRIYPGGVMGDDQAMFRKMRAGQLHGGGFTMTGISTIVPDFRIMSLPFLFNNYQEVDVVAGGLTEHFQQQFSQKRLHYLALNEVGFVYTMSTRSMSTMEELKAAKAWSPAGDPISAEFLNTADMTAVPLSIPDVLSSLQTGLIDTVFNSLYGSIVLQWFTKAQYISDTPYGYAYGAFVMDKRAMQKLPPEYVQIIEDAADKHFAVLLDLTRQSNHDSRQVLIDNGVQFIQPDPAVVEQLKTYRKILVDKLKGNAFSEEVYKQATQLLEEYRNSQQNP